MPRVRRPLLALIGLVVALAVGYGIKAIDGGSGHSGLRTVALSTLPPEAGVTVRLIERGGPYPYRHDGIEYRNLEGNLPQEGRGYYHEYTVVTPGSSDRGARRIVVGRDGTYYYTDDHYASFEIVDVSR